MGATTTAAMEATAGATAVETTAASATAVETTSDCTATVVSTAIRGTTMVATANGHTSAVSATVSITATVAVTAVTVAASIAITAAEPGTYADKHATIEPLRPVVAIRRTGIRSVVVVAIRADRRTIRTIAKTNRYLGIGLTRRRKDEKNC
jgi:hypothetical protein